MLSCVLPQVLLFGLRWLKSSEQPEQMSIVGVPSATRRPAPWYAHNRCRRSAQAKPRDLQFCSSPFDFAQGRLSASLLKNKRFRLQVF